MALKKRAITKTLFKLENNKPYNLRIDEPIFTGKKIEEGKYKDMEPARLANVTDLDTGAVGQIIVPKVLESTLDEEFPNKGYVGKAFEIVKFRDAGSKYNTFNVSELVEDEPAPTTGKGKK